MRRAAIIVLLLCSAMLWSQTQAPQGHLSASEGDVSEGKYSNTCLGIAYPIPTDWTFPVGENIPGKDGKAQIAPGGGLILLMLDHRSSLQGGERVVISALELRGSQLSAEQYVTKIVSIDRYKTDESPVPGTVVFNGRTFAKTFYRIEQNGTVGYKAMVATKFRGYFLGFTFLGTSTEAVAHAIDTLQQLTFADDEPDPRCAQAPAVVGGQIGNIPPEELQKLIDKNKNAPLPPGLKRIRVSQGVSNGMLITKVTPQYPAVARESHIEGSVILKAVIDKQGNIQSLELLEGEPSLAASAMAAVKQWKYKPYLLNGEPVLVETQITVNFVLSN